MKEYQTPDGEIFAVHDPGAGDRKVWQQIGELPKGQRYYGLSWYLEEMSGGEHREEARAALGWSPIKVALSKLGGGFVLVIVAYYIVRRMERA